MELYQLNYFTAAARVRNFTRAAQSLHISQPSLSKAIANLEAELGVPLFERDKKSICLTQYGEVFLTRAEKILAEAADAKEEIRAMDADGAGDLRIGSCCVFSEPSRIDAWNRCFFLEHPAVSMHLYTMETDRIEPLLLSRELDFGYSVTPSSEPRMSCTKLFSYRLGIVVPRGHPLADRGSIHLADLSGEPFLCNNIASDQRDSLYELAHKAGFEPDVIFEGESPQLIGEAVAAGRGVAFISDDRHAWQQENPYTHDDRIVFLRLQDTFCVRTVYLLEAKERLQTSCARSYRDGLMSYLKCQSVPRDS